MSQLLKNIQSMARGQLGMDTKSSGRKGIYGSPPWESDPKEVKNELFWKPIEIDPARWNKLYPYRLLVIDVSNSNKIVGGDAFNVNVGGRLDLGRNSENGIEYVITHTPTPGRWEFTLPITPQQLQIQDQYAINTSATMRGVVEEHGGLRFKMISANGTTGMWPRKPTKGAFIRQPSLAGSIFGGTLENFGGVAEGVSRIARAATGKSINAIEAEIKPENSNVGEFSTGYYQAMYLGQFVERYVQAKKDPNNKHWRLVFDIPKQNQSFIVTPVSYSSNQNAQKPNEILFSIQLKAWKRINLQQNITPAGNELPDIGKPNFFQRISSTIAETRRTLSKATNLVKAVRSDFQKVFNIFRQVSLVIKDLGGLAFAVGDFPRQLIGDLQNTIKDIKANTKSGFNAAGAGASSLNQTRKFLLGKAESTLDKANFAIGAIKAGSASNEGLSYDAIAAGALGDDAVQNLISDPINEVFNNPEENFDFFNEIDLDSLSLNAEQADFVQDELDRIELITIDDLREFRSEIQSLAFDISNIFGAGDESYSTLYGLPAPKDRVLPLTIEENEILISLFEALQSFDLLISTKQLDDLKIESPLEFVGGLANEAGINFQDFPSKLLVPVPFGSSIEEIAARYMGNADKWVEIVTLNGLRSPYIDEEGFQLDFLSNGNGRQFNVDNTDDQLFVGQSIVLQSDIVPPFTRRIINIEKIGDQNYLITINGLANLDNLTTLQNARMKGFLPGTVNSQNQIYIPVNLPAQEDDRTFEIPGLDDPNLTKVSKVDFLLTDNFDIALNALGDFRLANGLTNLIQALKIKIRTQKGTLLRHLDFGVGLTHGISIADIERGDIFNSLNEMIKGDPRYDFIESLDLKLKGSTLGIDMTVRLANNTGVVPISFQARVS